MEVARVADRLSRARAAAPATLLVAALLALLCQLTIDGCATNPCPDGTALDPKRSKTGAVAFCQNRTDPSRALWIELQPDASGKPARRQVCSFLGGRAGGPYTAFHPNGARWLEGQYDSGQKTGRWTQWSPDGRKVAEGLYRDGQLIEGAPVGFPATCEKAVW